MDKPLAIFDVDGTQFKSSCVEKVIDEALRQGLFEPDEFESAFAARRRWQINNNEGVYQSYLNRLVGSFITSIAGIEVDKFNAVTQQMIREHRVRMFGYTASLARILKPGHTLIAISGSPRIVVKPFLDGVGFNQVLGSTFEEKDGVFTGQAEAIDKLKVVSHLLSAGRYLSVGIGDTIGDAPVLESAQCSIAFNPSATLRREAIDKGWFMVTEHKDAVTQFLPSEHGYEVVFDPSPSVILDRAGIQL